MALELTYEQQQLVIRDDVWFSVLITFWNDDNDTIKEASFLTQYPGSYDIEQTLHRNALIDNCKDYDGEFDYFEITKVELVNSSRPSNTFTSANITKLFLQNMLAD